MNKLFAKIASITAGLALVAGAGVALASHADAKGVKADAELAATFTCGADGSASHNDGTKDTAYSETVGDYTLSISSGNNFYKSALDAKGNGCFKLGTSKAVGSFSLTAPSDVVLVKIYVGGYKATAAKISVNSGTTQTISTLSNNGEYTAVGVDTSSSKSIAFTTVTGGVRCMINTIEYYVDGGGEEKQDTSVSIGNTKPLALDVNDDPVQLSVTTSPSGLSLSYVSSNPSVASVSDSGLVTPVGTGSTTITVSYAGDDQYKASSDTITVNVSEAEPAHITNMTISEIVAATTSATPTRLYEIVGYVTAWKSGSSDGSKYGNFYIADAAGDTTNHAYVYGANHDNVPTWDGSKYTFTNNQTFLTDEVTKQIVIGSKVSCVFMAFMYSGSTFEFQGSIVEIIEETKVLTESLTISGEYPTVFDVEDTFSHEGAVVTAHYDNGSDKDVTSSAIFEVENYTNWTEEGNEGQYTVNVSYSEDEVTATASYSVTVNPPVAKHIVSFNPGDGEGSMESVEVKDSHSYTLPDCTFTAPEGKVFAGWTVDGSTIITVLESVTGDVVVTALYEDAPSEVEATMEKGTGAYDAVVKFSSEDEGKSGIKLGTSSAGGSLTITVGANAKSISFYAVAWKGSTSTTLSFAAENVTFNPTSVTLTADDGAASNSPYTLGADESTFKFTVNFTEVSAETAITVTASARAIVWGATYSYNGETPQVATLVSIAVSNPKTEYKVGEEFVEPTVIGTYSNESSKEVSGAVFTGFNSSVAVESQTISVSYTEGEVVAETSFEISVVEPTPVSVGTYKKVTAELANFSGDYLIVYEDGNFAFDGSLETLDASSNTQAVTIAEDGTIQLSEAYEFHIASKEGGYSIQSSSGLYIGKTADSNGLDSKATDQYVNTISYVGGETSEMGVVGSGGAHLRYNANSGQERFRFFKSSSYTGQKAIAFYKQVDDKADALALDILNLTFATCSAEGEHSKSDFASTWSNLQTQWNALSVDEKAKLVGADSDKNGTMLAEAMAKYELLCAKYGLDAFIEGRVLPTSRYTPTSTAEDSNVAIAVVAIVAVASISAIAVILIIKRRKAFDR